MQNLQFISRQRSIVAFGNILFHTVTWRKINKDEVEIIW